MTLVNQFIASLEQFSNPALIFIVSIVKNLIDRVIGDFKKMLNILQRIIAMK